MSAVAIRGALAIHPGALGDVLLALPALRALRATSGRVTLAAQRHIAALVAALGESDGAVDFERLRLDALFTDDGHAELPPADQVVCWFGARDGDFTRRLRALAPGAVVAPSIATGLVWEHLLRTSGAAPDGDWRTPARVAEELLAAGRAALLEAGWDGRRRLIVVQAGAGSVSKCWPTEGFAAALADLPRDDVTVVLHEGPADAAAVDALSPRVAGALRLRAPALPALAGVLRLAAVYVGNDSGVSHLAASVGAPSVIVFAAENLGWRPWAAEPQVLTVALARVEPGDVTSVRAAMRQRLA